ncbi:hypothetical protein AMTR_s00016p00212820 [Amborella trichopoda]|uniref:Uncharacterized protein n=1 Tax=Amborella trichopoda TaxID=13333 RepID=W1PE94_AMBTC|nr:hypothetical protein AMTR_s00016p00212820 [Amborella trichopoda]
MLVHECRSGLWLAFCNLQSESPNVFHVADPAKSWCQQSQLPQCGKYCITFSNFISSMWQVLHHFQQRHLSEAPLTSATCSDYIYQNHITKSNFNCRSRIMRNCFDYRMSRPLVCDT